MVAHLACTVVPPSGGIEFLLTKLL